MSHYIFGSLRPWVKLGVVYRCTQTRLLKSDKCERSLNSNDIRRNNSDDTNNTAAWKESSTSRDMHIVSCWSVHQSIHPSVSECYSTRHKSNGMNSEITPMLLSPGTTWALLYQSVQWLDPLKTAWVVKKPELLLGFVQVLLKGNNMDYRQFTQFEVPIILTSLVFDWIMFGKMHYLTNYASPPVKGWSGSLVSS